MDSQGGHVMTIANSIIGVSILAMPYCFKQCGIILSCLMLILSSIISRLSCHFLLKSAIISRLKTIEYLAFHTFGALGKFIIEIGIIGFLLGTCIAFFVVMGDLGPQIFAEMFGVPNNDTLRTSILIFLAIFCILPLGLLRNVDSLNIVCTVAIGFYICLVLKIMAESAPHIMNGDWFDKVEFWREEGILQCLPIFSMALFCQTQLFEIYQVIPNASLERMNGLIRVAVNICTCVYIFVGTFGYIAVASQSFAGNILLSFKPSFITEIMKIGFIMSVVFSFPLIIFPCRASLFSLIYKPIYSMHDGGGHYIPDTNFRYLTVLIITISLIVGILVPSIELVLGLVGSTIGVLICVLFPATAFICLSKKNTNERILAQIMLFVGILVMVLGTYANLNATEDTVNPITEKISVVNPKKDIVNENKIILVDIPTTVKIESIIKETIKEAQNQPHNDIVHEVRHEPPQPVEPEPEMEKRQEPPQPIAPDSNSREIKMPEETNKEKKSEQSPQVLPNKENIEKDAPAESPAQQQAPVIEQQVDSEAIKKEDKEIKQQEQEMSMKSERAKKEILEFQKQTKDLIEKQQKIIDDLQRSRKNELDAELNAKKLEKIVHIGNIAMNAIESIVEGDGKTEKNSLKELIEPKNVENVAIEKIKNEVKSNDDKPSDNKLSDEAPVISIAPLSNRPGSRAFVKNENANIINNFVPIPIVKSNLLPYNLDLNNKTGVSEKPIEQKDKNEDANKVESNAIEEPNKLSKEANNKDEPQLQNSDQAGKIADKEIIDKNDNDKTVAIKPESRKETDEVEFRRDLLSLNKTRVTRDVPRDTVKNIIENLVSNDMGKDDRVAKDATVEKCDKDDKEM